MEKPNHVQFLAAAIVCLVVSSFADGDARPSVSETSAEGVRRRTYIVHVRPPVGFSDDIHQLDLERWHESFLALEPNMANEAGGPSLVHSYRAAILGFAAKLTAAEAARMAAKESVLGVYPSRVVPLHTTHSPDFLGLRASSGTNGGGGGGAWGGALGRMGEGVVIGVLDDMVNPRHVSFRDDGMRAPPAKWRGKCDFWGGREPCNRKIVGGRTIFGSLKDGHGTHTASTAAGNFVAGAGVLGSGNGTATGMAPRAHLAIYEVCSATSCDTADVLAGMDSAISDGVDVLSLSLGGNSVPFYRDPIAIGAFRATQKGIFVSCSAGNEGPDASSLGNDAPWILTVGAGTMDRRMQAVVKLGDGQTFVGESAYQPHDLPPTPLVTPAEHGSTDPECKPDMPGVAGKLVVIEDVCLDKIQTGRIVRDAGGAGMLLAGDKADGSTSFAEANVLPASYVPYLDGVAIRKYMNSTKNPVAEISFHGTSFDMSSAPAVASLSSRGPSLTTPGIVKPDIIGPGINVIAAWPFKVGTDGEKDHGGGIGDFSDVTFNILSGTSMSTPHLSGIVALIKSEHPSWSPAMIKSAIMTTADTVRSNGKPILDEKLNPAGVFAMGAGHVNPSKAVNPGLVYDIDEAHYIAYICGLGYTDDQVEIITHKKGACKTTSKITGYELNYPSIVGQTSAGEITVNRTLTNVDNAHDTYKVEVSVPNGIVVKVSPSVLEFGGLNDRKSFMVRMSWDAGKTKHVEGSLKWVSKTHVVSSPIVIF
ncbi:hypothetical protein ACP70R_044351 [Stipagrostis hirtigluma subsp. patula]